ncbi:MAG: SDR family oxidoreductase [Anaerolineae bacterium]|nr:SDR family oxidoreductase [Anaerolineae bacterium]
MSAYPSFRLDGQIALITGASKGLGWGIARALANAGATVALTARTTSALEQLAAEIRAEGGTALPLALDVTDIAQINAVVGEVVAHFGRLDIMVNNAGLGAEHAALDVTEADWDALLDVNLKGLFFCCQAAARVMLPRGYGRIVNMSSQLGAVGLPGSAVYCASKGGVNQLTRALALEWSARGVTVNAVAPTFIYTPGTAERLDDPDYLAGVLAKLPIGKVGTINDVAAAIIYLASPAAGMVSGHVLHVDGGWTAQ